MLERGTEFEPRLHMSIHGVVLLQHIVYIIVNTQKSTPLAHHSLKQEVCLNPGATVNKDHLLDLTSLPGNPPEISGCHLSPVCQVCVYICVFAFRVLAAEHCIK